MKEIKAYIRPDKAEKVIFELEIAGVKGMTVINVSTLGGWVDPKQSQLSLEYCEKYCSSIKIELVCADEDYHKFIDIILNKGYTGQKGDGKIFVSDITEAYSIRTKEQQEAAL
ncbi:MAG: transcriptional regulator [Ignavibacteriae bacterium HGW-Ignavibacteriae-3]|nr:MAG: transcriptional regulator [Ignavibacteriae bacterium HGW-Ignavibacteriae-3]